MKYTKQPINTLVDVLNWRAKVQGDQVLYTWLSDDFIEHHITYLELDRKARAIAALLQSTAKVMAEPVLLCYPPGLEYIAAFLGCLYAGAIAVPVYPPTNKHALSRFNIILKNTNAAFILTNSEFQSVLQASVPSNITCLITDTVNDVDADAWTPSKIARSQLALLQYTSGSTANPKGVMVTHGHLMHNENCIKEAFGHSEESVIVGWLPLYHDMGLIGNVLQPLYIGARAFLMSPLTFVKSPRRWLEAISKYQATTSGGPNFSYDLCVRRIKPHERSNLDLSSWKVAFNGSEMVQHRTLTRFADAFAECGFSAENFYPCYGLAESTLFVTGGSVESPVTIAKLSIPAMSRRQVESPMDDTIPQTILVGCGYSYGNQEVVIVNPDDFKRCDDKTIGEIWISGESVCNGYWQHSETNEARFYAQIGDESEDKNYLRTGDLGFWYRGELFISGRLKDLIIIRGRNFYPQDIEITVQEAHYALKDRLNAVFSILNENDGTERLVIISEIRPNDQFNYDEIITAIRQHVSEVYEIAAFAIVLVYPRTISRTTSGKIQRYLLRQQYEAQSLRIVADWELKEVSPIPTGNLSSSSTAEWLATHLSMHLHIPLIEIDHKKPVTIYGIDSLVALELSHLIEVEKGVSLNVTYLLDGHTIHEIAEIIQENEQSSSPFLKTSATDTFPLSQGQRSLWLLHRIIHNTSYNLNTAFQIHGEIDEDILRQVFKILIMRHDILRTIYVSDGVENLVQRILPECEPTLIVEKSFSEERFHELIMQPFNLERELPLHITLFQSPQNNILLMRLHHIACDFWSLVQLISEFQHLYAALQANQSPSLPTLSYQYVDYVAWQQNILSKSTGKHLRDYWIQKLQDPPVRLDLPFDRPPDSSLLAYHGTLHQFRLDKTTTEYLKALAASRQTTLYTILLSVLYVMLHHYSHQDDIIIGSMFAGRSTAYFRNLCGYIANPLPLRVSITTQMIFDELLAQVKKTVLEALEHQDFPFNLMVDNLQYSKHLGRNPLFQVLFTFQKSQFDESNTAAVALNIPHITFPLGKDVHLETIALEQITTQFELALMMTELDGELVGNIRYSTDMFDVETIEAMAEYFAIVARKIKLDRPVSTTESFQKSGLATIPSRLMFTESVYRSFERQVVKNPSKPAIIGSSSNLTYDTLNQRANRLAHYMQSQGVQPNETVGILMHRHPDFVCAILATWKIGCAYLPLDPNYPEARLRFMIQDAQITTLIAEERGMVESFTLDSDVLLITKSWMESHQYPISNLSLDVSPEQTAYIIYTSGSTGEPKGVIISHGALSVYVDALNEKLNIQANDRQIHTASFSFAASIRMYLLPLLNGGTVIIPTIHELQDPLVLFRMIREYQVTIIGWMSSYWRHCLNAIKRLDPKKRENLLPEKLRVMTSSSEALTVDLVNEWYVLFNKPILYLNLYGLTETTGIITVYELLPQYNPQIIPVGQEIAHTRAYILDDNLQVVPPGSRGKLYISSLVLSDGYYRSPHLTAERYRPDPFANVPGTRMFRTGDIARRRANGDIEYLGREDNQVKIRGMRVSFEEISVAISRHAEVQESFTVFIKATNEHPEQLISYIVVSDPVSNNLIRNRRLRQFLLQQLPSHMIPTQFIAVEMLPRMPNGKVDQNKLLTMTSLKVNQEFPPATFLPTNDVEEVLADIWKDVLSVEHVGIHDNFFDLGGTSFSIIQLQEKVCSYFNLDLPIIKFFQYSTIHAQATFLLLDEDMTHLEKGKSLAMRRRAKLKKRQLYRRTRNNE